MDRRVTPPKWVTSPIRGTPPPCKKALSSACARTNVILAEKCGSRRQSTASFSQNVVAAKTSYQNVRNLIT